MQETLKKAPRWEGENRRSVDNAPRSRKHSRRRRGLSAGAKILMAVMLLACTSGAFALGWHMGVDSMTYTGDILLVNDSHRLAADYVPEGLVNLYEQRHSFWLASSDIYLTRECYEAAEKMFAAAEAENVNGFIITSGYRDYNRQQEIFDTTEAGKAQEPGASEHQTGLAFDVTAERSGGGFETTRQYVWLCKNAHKYGFIQRYPANKSDETGISYEPWHYRYVGVEAATKIKKSGKTLEAFLGAL